MNFGGARAACLTGTVPAYGAAYIAQNWCRCSPAQIPGLMALTSIGHELTPQEMVRPTQAVQVNRLSQKNGTATGWSTFRGNAQRSSSASCAVSTNASVAWSSQLTRVSPAGTPKGDWAAYLNSKLTAAVLTEELAIVADIDHNEILAMNRKTGKPAWTFWTASRVDVSPTVYKGLCLIGDHSGTVYAVNVETGELVYQLRIAPQTTRMMSYGKVESVWPVIGGVMVSGDGMAYASAGRTQGSDGGLVVRCFEAETGKHIWAKAIPQSGEGIQGKPRRNGCVLLEEGFARVQAHRMNLKTGEFELGARGDAVAAGKKAYTEKHGKEPGRREIQVIERELGPARTTTTMGLEGLYSWNWTHLGNRKFGDIGYDGKKGMVMGWNADYCATSDQRGSLKVQPLNPATEDQPALPSFERGFPATHLITSLVLCQNMVVVGGLISGDSGETGFVMGLDITDPKNNHLEESWTHSFASKLAFNGLAVDGGEVVASFQDGSVVKIK